MPTIAQRKFSTSTGKDVGLSLMQPIQEKGRWRCDYQITYNDRIIDSWAAGFDSIDALLSALTKAKIYLINEKSFKDLNIYWISEGDLGIDFQY